MQVTKLQVRRSDISNRYKCTKCAHVCLQSDITDTKNLNWGAKKFPICPVCGEWREWVGEKGDSLRHCQSTMAGFMGLADGTRTGCPDAMGNRFRFELVD
ncbi:MAG TPA: hypothetical protein EYQ21_02655 [Flavobacteriales bacterium]|jgi:hypothetical protein|nr:hypothetical protein [Flavobacteriales bacterium]